MTEAEKKLCEWQFGMSGSFMTSLFKAMSSADSSNMMKLHMAFPDEVDAFQRYRNESGYWEKLRKEFES